MGRAFLLSIVFTAALAMSVAAGTPADPPSVALGWPLLLHVERASALIGVVSFSAVVGWRAVQGELPVRVGQIEYEAQRAVDVDGELHRRVIILERLMGVENGNST